MATDGVRPRVLSRALAWVLPVVLVVLLAALVATSLVLWRDRHDPAASPELLAPLDIGSETIDGGDPRVASAVAGAITGARTYFSLDYRRVDVDMDRMRALGTEEFTSDYDAMAPRLARRVKTRQLTLSAQVIEDGVATEFQSAARAQFLVSLDVTTRRPDARSTGAYRTRITLEFSEDRWLVASVDQVA